MQRLLRHVRLVAIVLQKSFCGMGLKFSEAWARRLNNDVGDHVPHAKLTGRFWQRVCGSIERRLSLVSFFGENLAAAAFGTFATLSANKRHRSRMAAQSAGYVCLWQIVLQKSRKPQVLNSRQRTKQATIAAR